MSFTFKQFHIDDRRCAMKVGTDGVLLGAWARPDNASTILDVGTGSGLIAIMLAQRFANAQVTGIDINGDAAAQAAQNMQASPWADRLTALQHDFLLWRQPVDAIVCNPPFFQASLRCPDDARATARHDDTLPLELLVSHAAELLTTGGILSVILPAEASFSPYGLTLRRRCIVQGTATKAPKRQLLEFVKATTPILAPTDEVLVLTTPDGQRTESHRQLTADFYL